MSEPVALTGPSSQALLNLLVSGTGAFIEVRRALTGLTEAQAHAMPQGWPYSIASLLAHMQYWQEWTLRNVHGESIPPPEHAETGWPGVAEGGWADLLRVSTEAMEACEAMAKDEAALARPLLWGGPACTVGYLLMSVGAHNAYHLGQIVLLRRLLGAWPPPGGGDTW